MRFIEAVRRRLPDYPPYYEAPTGDHLRMDQNVNLLGPHPRVAERVDLSRAHLYPSRDNAPLLEALARTFGLTHNHYFVSNGSDEALDWFLRVLLEPGQRVATPDPSYGFFANLIRLNRLVHVRVRTNDEFQIAAEGFLSQRPDLILVPNPNNPTGTFFDPLVIGRLLKEFDGPVLIDEAYAEFAQATVLPLIDRYPNLMVTRTLSKAYGLAGLRVGFGAAHPDVAELVRRAKHPFSVNQFSEAVAVAALKDPKPVHQAVEAVTRERTRLQAALHRLGFRVLPSQANFLLTLPPIPSAELYEKLRARKILTRVFPQDPTLRDYIRFTVGRPQDTDRLLETVQLILRTPEQEEAGRP